MKILIQWFLFTESQLELIFTIFVIIGPAPQSTAAAAATEQTWPHEGSIMIKERENRDLPEMLMKEGREREREIVFFFFFFFLGRVQVFFFFFLKKKKN